MKRPFRQKIKKAIQSNSAAEAAKLCRAQPDVDQAAREAIMEAVGLDQETIAEHLLPLLKPSWQSEPLVTAAKFGKTELVRKLIPFCDAEDDEALV
ncbi:hypothetical protein [Xanthomonas sp. GPE 39]|uniref:hypothetical protein n=1 Tax=Xanthomonas sp. GPE 39 TaxID=1583099 RepID=UPI0005F2D01C|nr:hypothetical protein [Xanthomonas sp. GPE 39]